MASGQKPFYIALAVIVVGGIAFIASRMTSGPGVAIPANVIVTAADTSGFRGYIEGSPTAPIEVTEYGDLECPICAVFATVQFPDVKTALIDAGKVRWRYRDYPLDGPHKHPRIAAHAAACASDQGKYWEVQEAMFRRQNEYALANDPMSPLSGIMKDAGLDVGAWTTCMKSAKYAGRIQASFAEGSALGVNGTPTFLIDGHLYESMNSDAMIKLVDSLIAAKPASAPAGAPAPAPHPGGK